MRRRLDGYRITNGYGYASVPFSDDEWSHSVMVQTTPTSADAATVPGAGTPRRWHALAILALVQFMIAIDNTVVNVALPSIRHDLDVSTIGLAWVVNAYLLAAGSLVLLGGRLADLLGRRRMFVIGTALFAVASLCAGLAQSGGMLISFRFLQGIGEAIAAPAALSMVPLLFSDQAERAKAFGVWGGIAGMGATIGVVLSGVLVDFANWRWIFLINVPISIVPLLLIFKFVGESRSAAPAGRRIDVAGAILVTAGCLGIVYGLLNAGNHGWDRLATILPLLIGAAALIAFWSWERHSAAPLLPTRFFSNRTRLSANVGTAIIAGSMMTLFFLAILYMQNLLKLSPLKAGLAYLPFMAAFTVGLVLATNLLPRIGARNTVVAAMLIAAVGMALMTQVDAHGSYVGDLLLPLCVTAVGLGMVNPGLQSGALHKVTEEDAGLASGVQSSVLQAGSATGLAVFVAVAVQRSQHRQATGTPVAQALVSGYHLAFLIVALVLVAGAVITALTMQNVRAVPAAVPGGQPAAEDGARDTAAVGTPAAGVAERPGASGSSAAPVAEPATTAASQPVR